MCRVNLSAFLFLFLVVSTQTYGLKQGDVAGGTGEGRHFSSLSVDVLKGGDDIEANDAAECCMSCEHKRGDTQIVHFQWSNDVRICECLEPKPHVERVTTFAIGRYSGVCTTDPLFPVIGGVGYERQFLLYTVEKLGYKSPSYMLQIRDDWELKEGNVTYYEECCGLCKQKYPDTQMYNYRQGMYGIGLSDGLWNCECLKTIPDKTPRTHVWKYYAEICDMFTCPKMFIGDNNGYGEIFIHEHEITQEGCMDTCQTLYPDSIGITESRSETYRQNGQKKCWCEFGAPNFSENRKYQTCLFQDFTARQYGKSMRSWHKQYGKNGKNA